MRQFPWAELWRETVLRQRFPSTDATLATTDESGQGAGGLAGEPWGVGRGLD
jgi:hypothetical protein